jgi:hypothetical protein
MTKNQAKGNCQFCAGALTLPSSADHEENTAGKTMNNGERGKELTRAEKGKAGKDDCGRTVREILFDAGETTWQANPIVITSAQ